MSRALKRSMVRKLPDARKTRGLRLTLLALELGFERRVLEHVPILGDWLLRRRIMRRIAKYRASEDELF